MRSFSVWHWALVLLLLVALLRGRGGRQVVRIQWRPLFECGTGFLIAWLLMSMLREL